MGFGGRVRFALGVAMLGTGIAAAPTRPGTWDSGRIAPILERTARVRLAPDLSGLGPAERSAVEKLIEAGRLVQEIYEQQLHRQAFEARVAAQRTPELRDLYRMFHGPVATTLDNRREPFLPVDPEMPGKNVWPWGTTREEVEAFLAGRPGDRGMLLDPFTVVRRSEARNLELDRAALGRVPALDLLHPGLRGRLDALSGSGDRPAFYAIPYSLASPEATVRLYGLLNEAAAAIAPEDPDFAAYLANRARDVLSDDYESGDASWVTGRFGRLNAQIGPYETYDDALYGVKAFWSLSLLVRDEAETRRLARGIADLQALEDGLPYGPHKRVRSDIPIGVYDVVADFGQARSANTATILPNDAEHARKYGRTILIRGNILRDPELLRIASSAFEAAVSPAHAADLGPEGNFQRTLWHEIGHYLGPSLTQDGRDVSAALERNADLLEELKSDLVALHVAPALHRAGLLDERQLRSVYASGVHRTLQSVKPRRAQPYQTMQLMQLNRFLDRGLLAWRDGRLAIDYAVYHEVVTGMLQEVLALQQGGDIAAVDAFVERWSAWDEARHGALAARIRTASPRTYRLLTYAALGD